LHTNGTHKRRAVRVLLPALGIIALSGCIKVLCGSWLEALPQTLLTVQQSAEQTVQPTAMILTDEPQVLALSYDESPVTASPTSRSTATIQGCGLYIDGEFYGAFSSADSLRGILESMKNLYATGAEGETVTFTREVKLVEGSYPAADLLTYSGIKAVLESTTVDTVDYLVEEGDTAESIAEQYDMTGDELTALNRSLSKKLTAGNTISLNVRQPLLQVESRRTVTETVTIPYETEVVTGGSGSAQIITAGVNGQKTVTETIVSVNGKEISRQVLSETVLSEPVTQQMTAGSGNEVTYSASYYGETGSGVLNEGMIWPLPNNGGNETCQYSENSHMGLDLAIDAGTDIYAAASGTVVVAGWYYTYGNCVVIDHGNGVRTLYAHCSSLNTQVGDEVSQGDVIGSVGMTGNATGNHLHFEVHINNRTRNPLNFIAR
jgi:murein DD-endopeptidase MepM/ murein hydrolase activator NlpD